MTDTSFGATRSKRALDRVGTVNRRVATSVSTNTPGDLLVAVSGGADSTCLLHALVSTSPETVTAACFVDHGLREDGPRELAHVKELCKTIGIPLHVRSVDTKAFIVASHHSMECAARVLRYETLRTFAADLGAKAIGLGHTANDQVETVLMHELRGAGLSGLTGMRELRGDLFRPLLTTSHAETTEYCRIVGLEYLEDPSNDDRSIPRNRLRHDIIPSMEALYPGARDAILRLASTARRDADHLELLASDALTYVGPEGEIVPAIWAALPESLQFHVLRLASRSNGAIPDERALTRWARQLSRQSQSARRHRRGAGVLFKESQTAPTNLLVPGVSQVSSVRFSVSFHHMDEDARRGIGLGTPDRVCMDVDKLEGDVSIRSWLPGDRVHPIGSTGSRKLQDIFVDRGVPKAVRDRVPVVECCDRIIWIAGVALSDEVRVSDQTRRIVRVVAGQAES